MQKDSQQKFKAGDNVKIIKNSYSGYWPASEAVFVVKDFYNQDVDIEGLTDSGRRIIQVYHPDDLELAEKQEHPNQKLANAVAEILRDAADYHLAHPRQGRGKPSYSCFSASDSAKYKGWSGEKVNRVLARYLKSLGVDIGSCYAIPLKWSKQKKQETRHAWLYIAAQFAEENPDLVPTYGKKKVKI